MSISHIIDKGVCPPAWTQIRAHRVHSCTDLQFDRELIGLLRLNGNIPPGGPRTFLHTDQTQTINWKTFNKSDIPAGNDGDYLQTINGEVEWAPPTFDPSVLNPGSSLQIMHTNSAGTAAEWTSNLEVPGTAKFDSTLLVLGSTTLDSTVLCNQTLTVDNNLFVNDSIVVQNDLQIANGDITVDNGATTLVDLDVNGDLQLSGSSGTSGQVIVKTGPNTQSWQNLSVTPTNISPGTANQLLVTDVGGTAAQWASNVIVPGSLNVVGDLQFNSSSGTTGQFVKKTSGTTQAFSNIVASDITAGSDRTLLTSLGGVAQWLTPTTIRNIKYGTTFTAQNLNAGTGPTAVTFSTVPFLSINSSNTTPVTGITQPSATQFVINDTGSYNVSITGYIDPTSLGLGNSVFTLTAEVAGTEQQVGCVTCSADYSFSGTIPGLTITSGQVLQILVRRVVGTRPMSTFSSASVIPNFASNIVISLN